MLSIAPPRRRPLALAGYLLLLLLPYGPARLCAQAPYLRPAARSADLLPRDNREPFFPSAILHADSTAFLLQFHNRAGCGTATDCYHYRMVRVDAGLGQSRMLSVDLGPRDPSSFFTVNQLGERVNVYFRDMNPETDRKEYYAAPYRARDFRPAGPEVPVGSIRVSKHGRAAGASFRTNDATGCLATLLQDKSERGDAYAPLRITVYDSLHRMRWQRDIATVGGSTTLRLTDAMLRDDGRVVALVEFGDRNDRFLLVAGPDGVSERRLELRGTQSLTPWLEYRQGAAADVFVHGRYAGADTSGLFLLRFAADGLQLRQATAVPLPNGLADYVNHLRLLPTPDGGAYLVGDEFRSELRANARGAYVRERYGKVLVLRFAPDGRLDWMRPLYRNVDARQQLSVSNRFGVHRAGNDLVVVFNHDRRGNPVTGAGVRPLTFLPDMGTVVCRLTPDNAVATRELLPFAEEKAILVPPVSVLAEDGTQLHAAVEKPLGFRKLYTYTLDW